MGSTKSRDNSKSSSTNPTYHRIFCSGSRVSGRYLSFHSDNTPEKQKYSLSPRIKSIQKKSYDLYQKYDQLLQTSGEKDYSHNYFTKDNIQKTELESKKSSILPGDESIERLQEYYGPKESKASREAPKNEKRRKTSPTTVLRRSYMMVNRSNQFTKIMKLQNIVEKMDTQQSKVSEDLGLRIQVTQEYQEKLASEMQKRGLERKLVILQDDAPRVKRLYSKSSSVKTLDSRSRSHKMAQFDIIDNIDTLRRNKEVRQGVSKCSNRQVLPLKDTPRPVTPLVNPSKTRFSLNPALKSYLAPSPVKKAKFSLLVNQQ